MDDSDRRRSRRRYAAMCGAISIVLLITGYLMTRNGGATHVLGVVAVGYGVGIAVAAVFLGSGYDPRRGKK
jgi:hypothetical protein